jgi:hypothetical protein
MRCKTGQAWPDGGARWRCQPKLITREHVKVKAGITTETALPPGGSIFNVHISIFTSFPRHRRSVQQVAIALSVYLKLCRRRRWRFRSSSAPVFRGVAEFRHSQPYVIINEYANVKKFCPLKKGAKNGRNMDLRPARNSGSERHQF